MGEADADVSRLVLLFSMIIVHLQCSMARDHVLWLLPLYLLSTSVRGHSSATR